VSRNKLVFVMGNLDLTWCTKQRVLLLAAVLLVMSAWLLEPIAQPPSYHLFADRRSWFGIPNTLNLLSGIPFAWVGITGLAASRQLADPELARIFRVIFFGVLGTAFGSAYYHWQPTDQTLIWDRLPMAVAFMGFFVYLLTDRVARGLAKLLWPLCVLGVFSVFYWGWTEAQGAGDLRWYILVQFGPVLLLPLIVALYPPPRCTLKYYGGLLACYGLAKLFEHFDYLVWHGTGVVSGHTLKHLTAAVATWFILQLLRYQIRRAG